MKSLHFSIKLEQSVKMGRVFPVHAMKAYGEEGGGVEL